MELENFTNEVGMVMEKSHEHECIQQEIVGRFKEFIESTKWIQIQIASVTVAIVFQVITFGFLWGSLTNTVNKNTDYLWGTVTKNTTENTRNIDRLIVKLEGVKIIAVNDDAKHD